jgi:hypothetical protein
MRLVAMGRFALAFTPGVCGEVIVPYLFAHDFPTFNFEDKEAGTPSEM